MSPYCNPPWLSPKAAEAMRLVATMTINRRLNGAEEVRRVAWALHPALPARMISEAVEAVLDDETNRS